MTSDERIKIDERLQELEKEIRAQLEQAYRLVDDLAEAFDKKENYSTIALSMLSTLLDHRMIEYRTLAKLLKEAKE